MIKHSYMNGMKIKFYPTLSGSLYLFILGASETYAPNHEKIEKFKFVEEIGILNN